MSKIMAALILQHYEDVVSLLDGMTSLENQNDEAFWVRLKISY
jgi:hypothetical protein